MSVKSPCLVCGTETVGSVGRRLLGSPTNCHICSSWKDLLLLKGRCADVLLNKATNGYLCRHCFNSVQQFHKVKETLLSDLNGALAVVSVPSCTAQATPPTQIVGKHSHSGNTEPGPDNDPAAGPSPSKRPCRSTPLPVFTSASSSSSPGVQVVVGYTAQPKRFNLTPSRKGIGKAVARGSRAKIAKQCLDDLVIRKHIIKHIGFAVKSEIVALCSDRVESVLRQVSKESLTEFKWYTFLDEMKIHAPILFHILQQCTTTKVIRANANFVIGMCGAMLCKLRSPKMSLIHRILSLILYSGHCSKAVFSRLHTVGIVMSHSATIKLLDKLGEEYNAEVHRWREALEQTLVSEQMEIQTQQTSVFINTDEDTSQSESSISVNIFDGLYDVEDMNISIDSAQLDLSTAHTLSKEDSESEDGMSMPSLNSPLISSISDVNVPTDPQDPSARVTDISSWHGFTIVGDNLDMNVHRRHTRINQQTRSLHYFQTYAVKDRVNLSHLTDDKPQSIPLVEDAVKKLIPTSNETDSLRDDFIILLAQFLCDYLTYFKDNFKDVVDSHILHIHSKEMSHKSEVYPLGVILKNENIKSEVIDIMENLQQYVPAKGGAVHNLMFRGDQLTASRARACSDLRLNSDTAFGRLDTFVPIAEDWHTFLVLLKVIWNQLYDKNSCSNRGTLVQLKHLINRRDVPTEPKVNFHACDDFLTTVVKAHFIAAAMKELGMTSLEDMPQKLFDENDWMKSKEERKKILYEFCKRVITININFSFIPRANDPRSRDTVLEYAQELMCLGMVFLNYKDAVREGDGIRVLNIWKHILPFLRFSGRKNYSLEVLFSLYQYYFTLSPRQANQFLWSRFINTQGLPSKNKAGDLHMEHLNRVCKECITGLGANKTTTAIQRIGKAMGPLEGVLDNFDKLINASAVSGKHKVAPMDLDIKKIVSELGTSGILEEQSGRFHTSFPNFRPVLLQGSNKVFQEWIKTHLQSWIT